jgi:hypothetical protein
MTDDDESERSVNGLQRERESEVPTAVRREA